MPKIFLSYRRSDSDDIAGRIYDRLVAHFGKGSIFFDVDTIPLGVDFREFLQGEVQQCQVLVAIIGPTWLSAIDDDGHRRLDNTADWVRIELETALARQIPIIPLLVRGARLPKAAELPACLQNLAYRNATTARAGRDFHYDMDVLIQGIATLIERFIISTFKFEVVTINAQGKVVNTTTKTAEYFREDLGSGITLYLVRIPAGQFLMGAPVGEEGRSDDEGPQHRVTVPEFWLGKYLVTQAQYRAIMGQNPSRFSDNGANCPVEQVSWHDAWAFCQKLSQQTGRTYRLPSEAEWEYACRAGTTTPFHFGPTITPDLANYYSDYTYANGPKGTYREQTTEVGQFPPNALGCTTCTAMCGNGAPTTGIPTTNAHRPMAAHGYFLAREKTQMTETGSCAVVRGASTRGTAVLPIATPITWPTATTASACAWCVRRRGLFCSPFLFSTFELFTSLL